MDVVFTNSPSTRATVSPAIADHRLVTAELGCKVPEQMSVMRMVWQFANADSDKMRDMLSTQPCEDMFEMSAREAADLLQDNLRKRRALHTST